MGKGDIKSVAIFGVGEIGRPLADEFLAHGYVVTVVSRKGSTNKHLASLGKAGAHLLEVDYTSFSSIKQVVKGQNVVISTLSGQAFAYQVTIGKAAKEQGVSLFVPSMWGFDYTQSRFQDSNQNPPFVEEKFSLLSKLDKIGIPWIVFSNGLLTAWTFSLEHGIDAKNRSIHWQGNGDKLLTFSHLKDVASFARLVIEKSSFPAPGSGRWYYVESFRASFNQVFAEAQRLDDENNQSWKITRSSADEARTLQIQNTAEGEAAWHLALIDDGSGLRELNDNKQVGFEPKYSFQKAIQEALQKSRA